MREIQFTIQEKPIPQVRHRHRNNSTYDPLRQQKIYYKNLIRRSMYKYPPLDTPIEVTLNFFLNLPMTKKLRNSKGLYHWQKPDIDNLIKFILDVMNDLIYTDDSHICKINAAKYYSDNARTEVIVREIEQQKLNPKD